MFKNNLIPVILDIPNNNYNLLNCHKEEFAIPYSINIF